MPTRRSVLAGLAAFLAAPFVRLGAFRRQLTAHEYAAQLLDEKGLTERIEPEPLAPFWHMVADQFDILVAHSAECRFCDRLVERGEIVRMVPEQGDRGVFWLQCASCAAADLLPRARQSVRRGGLRLAQFATLAQIPTVRNADRPGLSLVDMSTDNVLRHARFTMLVSGGTCVCGADVAQGALVAMLPDPRCVQVDGLGSDGPALYVHEASCAARIILPRWNALEARQREARRAAEQEEQEAHVRSEAEALGRDAAALSPEARVEAIASRIAGAPAQFEWTAGRDSSEVMGSVRAGDHRWALRAKDGDLVRESILQLMTVSLVHEATGCACEKQGDRRQCPAYLAFLHPRPVA